MSRRAHPTVALVAAGCLSVASANASSIAVFFAPDGSDCDRSVAQYEQFEVYILAVLGGDAAAPGITGAEFRLTGFEPQPPWYSTVTPNPASNVQIGNPTEGGVNLAFPSCQSGALVLLYSIVVYPTQPVSPRSLRILHIPTPHQPPFPCPLVTLCDAPVYTKLCVPGGEAFINRPEPCSVGVEQRSWSQVKSLFN